MAGTLPSGIGNDQQALQATAFIRQQPWYLQWIASRGKRPDANGNVPLSDDERDQLRDLVVSKGIGLNNRYDGIDENGQIVEEHHKLRNGLIGAAIGGAALTGFGAAGIGPLAGAFGAGSSAAAGAGSAAATGTGAGAAGTVAGGAGVAGTAAASGAGWFSPASLIPAAIGGIASIYGANQQANANSDAAKLQFQSTEEALKDARDQRAYQQGQYADYLGRLKPYLGLGTTAGSTLQNLLARSPYTKMANEGPLPQYSTAPQRSAPQPMQQAPQEGPPMAPNAQSIDPGRMGGNTGYTGGMNTAAGPQLVMLRAPDGSTKQVSSDQAQHYIGLGATPV